MTAAQVFAALLVAAGLVLLGKLIRNRVALLRSLYLPSSVIAGAIALLLGPELLGRFTSGDSSLFGAEVDEVWAVLPGLLISAVFAALFLGKPIPSPRAIWRLAGPQVAFGQTIAWGQYVVGLLLGMLVLDPRLRASHPLAGALIEIGFEGGHGTAAGLGRHLRGVRLRRGRGPRPRAGDRRRCGRGARSARCSSTGLRAQGASTLGAAAEDGDRRPERRRCSELDEPRTVHGDQPRDSSATDPLSVHIGLVSIAITIGWLIQQGPWSPSRPATWAANDGVTELLRFDPAVPARHARGRHRSSSCSTGRSAGTGSTGH
jgi:glutamate:Na+ symporter, ESS family